MSAPQRFYLTDPAAGQPSNVLQETIDLIRSAPGGFAVPLPTAEATSANIVFGRLPGLPPFFVLLPSTGAVPSIAHSLRRAGAIVVDYADLTSSRFN